MRKTALLTLMLLSVACTLASAGCKASAKADDDGVAAEVKPTK